MGGGDDVRFSEWATPKRKNRHLSDLGRDSNNWKSADPEAWEQGRGMAVAIADTCTDADWAIILNTLASSRAAQKISLRFPRRPPAPVAQIAESACRHGGFP